MTTVSIFTPTHNPKHLLEIWEHLKDQPFDEWVIVYNNGATPLGFSDKRVKEIVDRDTTPQRAFVGRLKFVACSHCTGDVLVEVDHDDILLPGAVDEIRAAFDSDPGIGFVYSDTVRADATLTYSPNRFPESCGWRYTTFNYHGHDLDVTVSFPPDAHACSLIWYAPDHVRCFRRSVYESVGGYNRGMQVLDDQDLMCRMYMVTKFHHINKPLYVYRYGDNTYAKPGINEHIQKRTVELRDLYFERMLEHWADINKYSKVELGGRMNAKPGYTTVDLEDADVVCDLNEPWPFEDNSVGVIRSFDVFEHLSDRLHVMREVHRVLAPGGVAIIQVPSTDGRGFAQDPTHVSPYNENSFLYWSQHAKQKYIPKVQLGGGPLRFQRLKCYTTPMDAINVCWVRAWMMKIDKDFHSPGYVEI